MTKKIVTIFGTRPEIIKVAPVLKELEKNKDKFKSFTIFTGQHKEMSKAYLEIFKLNLDYNLEIMEKNQTLNKIISNVILKLSPVFDEIKPDIVLVQGDTSSAFAAALAAFHNKILVGHIEAGLRTNNKYNPFPEEINRRLISVISDFNFVPTENARNNLIKEGYEKNRIYITGNTIIDALIEVVNNDYIFAEPPLNKIDFDNKKVICITTHRRESFGKPILNTIEAIRKIVEKYREIEVVLPVHYNPNVRTKIFEGLMNSERIHLIEPLPYEIFVQLMNKSYLILTDSGGVQEEAPSLGKPVLILRETTERPEGVKAGNAIMVGTKIDKIISSISQLIEDKEMYKKMAKSINPYGDGKAARRIVDILSKA